IVCLIMSPRAALSCSITLRQSAHGLHYRLPRRRTPTVRLQVFLMVVVGAPLLVIGLTLTWTGAGQVPFLLGVLLTVIGLPILASCWAAWPSTWRSAAPCRRRKNQSTCRVKPRSSHCSLVRCATKTPLTSLTSPPAARLKCVNRRAV